MADAPPPATPPRQRGGRGRGGNSRPPRGGPNNEGGFRGGRGRGRGQGQGQGRGGGYAPRANEPPALGVPLHTDLPDKGISGDRLTGDAQENKGEARGKEPMEEDEDAEVCFICASPVLHQALARCNHRTCHICSLRLRALYKTKACAHCRVGLGHAVTL